MGEGDETLTVAGTVQGLSVTGTSLTLADDEIASMKVTLSVNPTSIREDAGGTPVTVTGTLDATARTSATAVTVSVGASGDRATEGTDYATVNDVTLTITAGQTSGTASFTLTPTDDSIDEAAETLTVDGTVQGLSVTGTTLTIADNDTRGIAVSSTSVTVAEGGSRSYTVVLSSQPTSAVTVTPSESGDADVTVAPSTLTFTTTNWSTAQTVTVSAAEDDDTEDDTATITHTVSGGDYGAVTATDVAVTVSDNDVAAAAAVISSTASSVGSIYLCGATVGTTTGVAYDSSVDVCWDTGNSIPTGSDVVIEERSKDYWNSPGSFSAWQEIARGNTFTPCSEGDDSCVKYAHTGLRRAGTFTQELRIRQGSAVSKTSPQLKAAAPNSNGNGLQAQLSTAMDEDTWTFIATPTGPFVVGLVFSEPELGATYAEEAVRGLGTDDFRITNGTVTAIEGWNSGGYKVRVTPTTLGEPVTIKLKAKTVKGVGEGVTAAGTNRFTRKNTGSNKIVQPTAAAAGKVTATPGLSVADAEVNEGKDATLSFQVTLSRAASGSVTVDWTTADGTATAGQDYTAANGTLTFARGETAQTVTVAVLDDAHDEGSETLTVTLSNPRGAHLADGEATGTINNTDPMPKAWLVRFGRTVGSQMVDALGARLERTGASHVTIAGMNLLDRQAPWLRSLPHTVTTITGEGLGDRLLAGTAFHLSNADIGAQGTTFTAWGQVAQARFDAGSDATIMDAEVATGLLGFDAQWGRTLAGIMLARSSASGAYRLTTGRANGGAMESTPTGIYPYGQLQLTERVSAWVMAGAGSGELVLGPDGSAPLPVAIALRMGALGVNGQVLDGSGPGGLALQVKTDALWVGTQSDERPGLRASQADATRLRLILAGERTFDLQGGGRVKPSGEVGLRVDGGDAETGRGLEVGVGMDYAHGALSIETQVRTLVAHEDAGYEEWGASSAIRYQSRGSGRGLHMALAPVWGNAWSGLNRLWSAADARALERDSALADAARLDAEVGYGLAVPKISGLVTPYAGLPLGADGNRRRLGVLWKATPQAQFGVEGSPAAHAVQLQGRISF